MLKLQPYMQSSVVVRSSPKLSFKYFGPYQVLEKIGSTAYKLELPEGSQAHPVFHVSQLKAYTSDHTPVFSNLTVILALHVSSVEPEKILERRLTKKGNAT